MSLPQAQETLKLLNKISHELKELSLWQNNRPNAEKMASTVPFHYDTLAFEQWLQFVFIERINQMIEQEQPLPSEISLSPIATESFKSLGDKANTLLSLIGQLDKLLSGRV